MGKRRKLFPKVWNKTRMPTSLLFNIVLEVLAGTIRHQKEIKASKLETKKFNYQRT
jgi:hypothetical protein